MEEVEAVYQDGVLKLVLPMKITFEPKEHADARKNS